MIEKNIYLIGMMGSGKTSTGEELAHMLQYAFVDLDSEIEQSEGMSIIDIFSKKNEGYFRRCELLNLQRLSGGEKQVIATGGGVVLQEENIRCMQATGRVIYLAALAKTLIERVRGTTHRPLLNAENWEKKLEELLSSRSPLYEKCASIKAQTDEKTPAQVAKNIFKELLEKE